MTTLASRREQQSRQHAGLPARGLIELILDDLRWDWNETLSLRLDAAVAAEEAASAASA